MKLLCVPRKLLYNFKLPVTVRRKDENKKVTKVYQKLPKKRLLLNYAIY